MSVPNQYSSPGGRRRRIGDSACGSIVPRYPAKTATSTISKSTTAPAMAVGCRRSASLKRWAVGETDFGAAARSTATATSVADPRIEQRVAEVDQQVDDDVHGGEQQRDALDDRIVAPQERVDGQPAEPRNREHGLGDDHAADQQRDAD